MLHGFCWLLCDDSVVLQKFPPTSWDIFLLYNPIFFIPSLFWYNGVLFVKLLLCRYSSIHSTCLVLASHRPISIPRSGLLQGNTFSIHSAEDPVAVAFSFLPFHLLCQWLVYAELLHKEMQLEPFFFTLIYINSEHCTRKLPFELFSLVHGGYILNCIIPRQGFVSDILFVEQCTSRIPRITTVYLQQCLCQEMEARRPVTPFILITEYCINFSSNSNNFCTADEICSN